jgi:hypothetical protein
MNKGAQVSSFKWIEIWNFIHIEINIFPKNKGAQVSSFKWIEIWFRINNVSGRGGVHARVPQDQKK